MVTRKIGTSWITDLLLVLGLTAFILAAFTAFTWWLAITILRPFIDVLALFHRLDPRDLAAAVRKYLGRDHQDAHSAFSA